MISGGQEFALIIIGMAMFSGVIRSSIAARHGQPMGGPPHWKLRERARRRGYSLDDNSGEVDTLKTENRRLTDQVETMQDRLIVLEKIVTDRGYTLASEIEALRDRKVDAKREVQ